MIIVDDGGHPPRRTLVNVTVNFPALVVAEPATGSSLSKTDTLLIVLGVFLTLFVILVILLSVYIARRCKAARKDSSRTTHWFFRNLYSTDNLDKTKSDLAKGDPRGKGFKQQKISHSQANTNMTLADELDTVSGSNGCGSNSVQESPFVDSSVYDVQPKDGYKRFKGGSSMESLYSDNGGSSLDRDTPIHSTN
ncbi:uncharacterized protein LOC115230626, partial [Octopus sinensis]|uniref:Uncharacterized protein LOC115230626 n=1 Tax=Octopus sinensis TaxID=2607531 RepID=A0A6P7U2X3_9MOLL